MNLQQKRRRSVIAVGAVIALATLVDVCCSAALAAPASRPAKDEKLAAMVPAELRARGAAVVATEPFFPPFQFAGADNQTLVGLNIDLGAALGDVLGLKITFVPAKFDEIIPGMQAKRYDFSIDAMADTPERRKQIDFVDYFQSGSALFVPAASTAKITDMAGLCGHGVGVVKGTFQVDDAEAQAAKCAAGGGKKLEVSVFPDQSAMILAVTSARVDAILMDSAVGNYLAQEAHGKFKQSGELTKPKRKGIAVPKSSPTLRDALQGAMQKLIDDGTYTAILKKYNQTAGALPKATINDGTTS
ncbi:MAG TPA: ABC transporter substrate-binding protein [Casimicrobiaceae bacterium]|jgi:polar amino acid transport system substrate-binding protein|nr:ABC transporter substrate-binding protein [Casimicrobiaceae bacterium]